MPRFHISFVKEADLIIPSAIENITQALKPGGLLFLTDMLSKHNDKVSPQQHVRWRNFSYYERELELNEMRIIYLAPMTTLFGSPIDSQGLVGKMLNVIYYGLTVRITSKTKTYPIIEKAYVVTLYKFDSLLTLSKRFGVSNKLLVAEEIR